MTDEGFQGDPMSEAEAFAAMDNLAKTLRRLFGALREEGFTEQQATEYVRAYIHGLSGGKLQ